MTTSVPVMMVDGARCVVFHNSNLGCYSVKRLSDGSIHNVSDHEFGRRVRLGRVKPLTGQRPTTAANSNLWMDVSAFDEKHDLEGLRRAKYCMAVIQAGMPSPQKTRYPEIAAHVASENNDPPKKIPDWRTLAAWVRDYRDAGLDYRVLIPRHHLKGRNPIIRTEEEKKVLQEFIEAYLTEERPRPALLYKNLRVRYAEEMKVLKNVGWHLPSRSAFYLMLENVDAYETERRRYGEEAARNRFKHGRDGPVAAFPLDVVELDSTKSDVEVWNDEMTANIGRPYVYVAIDRCTRMVVGIYIGFEPPSTFSVLQCVKNAVFPKDWLKDEYPDIPVEWNAWGAFGTAVTDNAAELLTPTFRSLLGTMGTEHHLAPVATPTFKGIVERFLKTYNVDGTARLPGKTFSSVEERAGYAAESKAVLTISEFRYYIHYWMLVDYCYAWHDGLGGVPALFWQERTKDYKPRVPDVAKIDALFGQLETATLKKTGLQFEYLKYKSSYLRRLFEVLGSGHRLSFRVDLADISYISVIDPTDGKLVRVPCSDQEYSKGLTLHQHRVIRKKMRELKLDWENSAARIDMRSQFIAWTEKLIEKGKTRAKSTHARFAKQGVVQRGWTPPEPPPGERLADKVAQAKASSKNAFSDQTLDDLKQSTTEEKSAVEASAAPAASSTKRKVEIRGGNPRE